jgi:tetratricopeptide (TPR) repeat protein
MPPSRRRLTRKQLKQPDEFITIVERLRDFVTNNLAQVTAAVIVILVAAVIVAGVVWYERSRDSAAGERLYQGLAALNAREYAQAEELLASLARDEPDRRAGRLARLYLASAYAGMGDFGKARDALVVFVAEFRDPLFASLALADLGAIYERMGDLAKAESAYRSAAGVAGPARVRAELGVARVLARMGKRDEAIETYRNFLARNPYAQERQFVLESLAQLGASPEVRPAGAAAPSAAEQGAAAPAPAR